MFNMNADLNISRENFYNNLQLDETILKYINFIVFLKDILKDDRVDGQYRKKLKKLENSIFNIMAKYIESLKVTSHIKVALIGNFSSGKSTILNSFLEAEICPTDLNATTSSITRFYYFPEEKITIDGKRISREEYQNLVAHQKMKGSQTKTYLIEYGYPSDVFSNIILYDSPGFDNPNNPNDEKETEKALESVDAILYVKDINNGDLGKDEVDRLIRLKQEGKMLFCILNKSDNKPKSAIEKIKRQINSYSLFIDVVDYSAINVLEEVKDNFLKKTFQDIEENIGQEREFLLFIKGKFEEEKEEDTSNKKRRRRATKKNKKVYRLYLNEKHIKDIKYLQATKKRDELIGLLKDIAFSRNSMLQAILKADNSDLIKDLKSTLESLLKFLNSSSLKSKNRAEEFEKVIDTIFYNLDAFEKNHITKDFQYRVVNAFKESIEAKDVPSSEKGYFFDPYWQIHFNKKKFYDAIDELVKNTKKRFNVYVEEKINSYLVDEFNFKIKIDEEIVVNSGFMFEVLNEWYYHIGRIYRYSNGEKIYFETSSEAKSEVKSMKRDLDKLKDKDIGAVLTPYLYVLNESSIEEKIRVLKSDKSEDKTLQELKSKIDKFIKEL